jgi:hypothetical protein
MMKAAAGFAASLLTVSPSLSLCHSLSALVHGVGDALATCTDPAECGYGSSDEVVYLQAHLKVASQASPSGNAIHRSEPLTSQLTSPEHQVARLAAAKPLQWMHVAKCGTSFADVLNKLPGMCPDLSIDSPLEDMTRDFGEDLPDCPGAFSEEGHEKFYDHSGLGAVYESSVKGHGVTMLRQPEQRIISAYLDYQHTWPLWYFGRFAENVVEFAHEVSGCAVRMLTRSGISTDHGHDEARPCGGLPAATSAEVALAKERLREGFVFVGLTDQWDLSMCLVHAMFGGECTATDFANLNPGTNTSANLYNTSILEGFTDAADGALYEEAIAIFSEETQRYGVSYASCQPCFSQATTK